MHRIWMLATLFLFYKAVSSSNLERVHAALSFAAQYQSKYNYSTTFCPTHYSSKNWNTWVSQFMQVCQLQVLKKFLKCMAI